MLKSKAILAIPLLLAACGAPAAIGPTVDPTVTVSIPQPITTIQEVVKPATLPVTTALRVEPPTTVATIPEPPNPCNLREYVNNLPYQSFYAPERAREAYRIVAACRGWDEVTITKWEHFLVDDVIKGESGFCPNLRSEQFPYERSCVIRRPGMSLETTIAVDNAWCDQQGVVYKDICLRGLPSRNSDSGFFQVVSLWYKPGGPLCVAESICSAEQITGEPWTSMSAGLFAVEYDGREPWCYNEFALGFHELCSTVTETWP